MGIRQQRGRGVPRPASWRPPRGMLSGQVPGLQLAPLAAPPTTRMATAAGALAGLAAGAAPSAALHMQLAAAAAPMETEEGAAGGSTEGARAEREGSA